MLDGLHAVGLVDQLAELWPCDRLRGADAQLHVRLDFPGERRRGQPVVAFKCCGGRAACTVSASNASSVVVLSQRNVGCRA